MEHPPKKMFWGSFSYYKVGSLLPIEEIINAENYINIVDKKGVAYLANAFPDGSGCFKTTLCHVIRQKK